MPFSFALCLPLPIPPSTPPFRISIVETIRLTNHPIPKSFRNHANITHSAPTKPAQPLGYPYSQTPPSHHLKPLIPTLDSGPFCLIVAFSSSEQRFAIGFLQLLVTTMSLPNRYSLLHDGLEQEAFTASSAPYREYQRKKGSLPHARREP